MSELLKQSQAELQQWRDAAIADGWLPQQAGVGIDTALAEDPTQLFSGVEQRPLVVAFFGGTGVGKSSLLNRLAGAAVARTGVIRPTSREVTVYAHESLSLTQLPAQIPADKVQVSSHNDAASSHVVWIDTPDVDSVATEHRDQVMAWIPYVDLLIYVVSPERYKDDAGWQMLREAGDQHAWMFVLNQWDRGQPEQLADFKRVLGEAGFSDPRVFCTICNDTVMPDDFDSLRTAVEQLGEKNNVTALIAQSEAAQAERLRDSVAQCIAELVEDGAIDTVQAEFAEIFKTRSTQIEKDLSWQINASAQRLQEERGGWRQLISGRRMSPALTDISQPLEVWDARSDQQVRDALSELSLSAAQQQLPQAPLRQSLLALADKSADIIKASQREELSSALAKPGTLLHRGLFKAVALVTAIAPILALGWIGYRVVVSFYGGNTAEGEYLGADFAINSVLLLAVAWLLPALLREKMRPSLSAAVERALRQGLQQGLNEVATEANICTRTFDEGRSAQAEAAKSLLAQLPTTTTSAISELASLRPRR